MALNRKTRGAWTEKNVRGHMKPQHWPEPLLGQAGCFGKLWSTLPSRGWPEERPGAQHEQGEAECCSRRPARGQPPWLCLQHGWERARLAQGEHVTTAGRGQPSPVPGPALTPGLHLELCDVVNFLCQILCPACQTDYCGAGRQQGGARRRKDRHAAYLCPSWGATTVVAGLAKEPQARSP